MVVFEWTDSIEKTLDVMRQNAAKLGEISQESYNALKKRIHYLQLPLAILSAANAYAVVDLDRYVSENYVTVSCCVVSATIAGYLSYDWYLDSQKKMELDFSFTRNCEDFSKQIKDILSVTRYERTVDGDIFLRDKFKQYRELISGNTLIAKFKGDLTSEKDSLCAQAEDMEELVMDHWNIIFRPTLRRFKKKNTELIEYVKKGGHSVNDMIEPGVISAAAQNIDFCSWITQKWAKKIDVLEEDIESNKKEEEKKEGDVNFSDVYTVVKEMPSIPLSKKDDSKKFHVAFIEQI